MNRFFRNTGFYLLIILVTVGIVNFITNQGTDTSKIPYNKFRQYLNQGQVAELQIRPDRGTYYIQGKLKDQTIFYTNGPLYDNAKLLQQVEEANLAKEEYLEQKGDSVWLTFLTSIIPFVIIFILFFFLLNQAQGGGSRVMNFGKSKAKLYNDEKKKVTFNDVAGADEEKAELVEVVEFLKDPRKFAAVGARIPKGVLLVGPPGTVKPCWHVRLLVKRAYRSSASAVPTSLKCLSVSVPPVYVTCLKMRKRTRHASSLLTRLMPWAVSVALALAADTMSVSRR